VLGQRKSIRGAYMSEEGEIGVSLTSVYNKLQGIDIATSAGMVRDSATACASLIDEMGGRRPAWLPNYRIRIVDGNCLAATEHRLKELRDLSGGPLPGKALVIYDPELGCVLDLVLTEDGHDQERALFPELLEKVRPDDLWIQDRNFCTRGFLLGVISRDAHILVREHKGLPMTPIGRPKKAGKTATGSVFEQQADILSDGETILSLRRITLRLKKPTRDGETEIHLLTNLPEEITAKTLAELYRKRWTIETAFQKLERDLNSEIKTLAYPPAALFAFCVALLAYNIMAVTYGALHATYGSEKIDKEFSNYFLADELQATYRGMMIAIPDENWAVFADMTSAEFAAILIELASHTDLRLFRKSTRGPKKPRPKRKGDKPHISTARLLAARKA
jgi:IS4 transposase